MSRISTRRRGRARLLGTAALAALVFSLGSLATPALAQPALEVLGTWGGSVNAVFINEAVDPYIAYVGSGRNLVILNVADPANIVELGSIDVAYVLGIRVRDGYAFVATGAPPNCFCVVDVSDPSAPELVWTSQETAATGAPAAEVDLYGDVAYVRTGMRDIEAFDVSDPENGVHLDRVVQGIACDSTIVGDLLYMSGDFQHLRIYDLSAPWHGWVDDARLQLVGMVALPGTSERGTAIAVEGNYAYAATERGTGVLAVVNVSDPNVPVVEGSYDSCWAHDVAVSGGIAYLVDCSELIFLDVATDPTTPSVVATYSTHGSIGRVEVVGNRAYVMDDGEGLIILDISGVGARGEPVRLGNWHSPSEFRQMDKVGDLLYVSDAANGITILDVSDAQQPALVGVYQTGEDSGRWGSNWGIEVRDQKAYLSAGGGGIEVVQVSDPAQPTMLGAFRFNAGLQAQGLRLNGDIAHVGVQAPGGGYLVNFGITDPTNIVDVGSLYVGSGPLTIDTTPAGIAYIARESTGGGTLANVNTSDPTDPFVIYNGQPGGVDLARDGDLLYIANQDTDDGGLYVLDVSDPANPAELGHFPTRRAYGVALQNGLAYLTGDDPENGNRTTLFVLDVSDPNAPGLLVKTVAPAARSVLVDGCYIYVTTIAKGLVTLRLAPLGDLDGDGDIDLSDLAALLGNYGTAAGATYEMGDLDGDGDVDLSDLAGLLARYGESCG